MFHVKKSSAEVNVNQNSPVDRASDERTDDSTTQQVLTETGDDLVSDFVAFVGNQAMALSWLQNTPSSGDLSAKISHKKVSDSEWTDDTALTPQKISFAEESNARSAVSISTLENGVAYDVKLSVTDALGRSQTLQLSNITPNLPSTEIFREKFDVLVAGNIHGQNGWTKGAGGTWTVENDPIISGNKYVTQTDNQCCGTYLDNFITRSTHIAKDLRIVLDFKWKSNVAFAPQIWFRASPTQDEGYLVYNNDTTWNVAIQKGGSLTPRRTVDTATAGFDGDHLIDSTHVLPLAIDGWYTFEASIRDDAEGRPSIEAYLYAIGGERPSRPIVSYTFSDPADYFPAGNYSIRVNDRRQSYDNIFVYDAPLISTINDLTATVQGGAAVLKWSSIKSGVPVLDYLVEFRESGSSTWTKFNHPRLSKGEVAISGLETAKIYEIRVTPIMVSGLAAVPSMIVNVNL